LLIFAPDAGEGGLDLLLEAGDQFEGDWGSGMTIDLFEPVALLEAIASVH
jgi:hypothetical protein